MNDEQVIIPEQRLSPWHILLQLFENIKNVIIIVLGGIFGAADHADVLWLIIGGLLLSLFGWSVVQYFNQKYLMTSTTIIIKTGVFIKKSVHIPLEKVQGVNLQQNLLLQIINHYDLLIDTAGQNNGDAGTIKTLPLAQAEMIKNTIYRIQNQTHPVIEPEVLYPRTADNIYVIAITDLVKYALTGLGPLSVLISIIAVQDIVSRVVPDKVTEHLLTSVGHMGVIMGLMFASVGLLIALVVDFLREFNRYYGFTLMKKKNTLSTEAGLVGHRTAQIQLRRLQTIYTSRKPLRRLLNLATFRADTATTAGAGNDTPDDAAGVITLMPVVKYQSAWGMIGRFIGETNFERDLAWVRPVSQAAFLRWRFIISWGLVVVITGGLGMVWFIRLPVSLVVRFGIGIGLLLMAWVVYQWFVTHLQANDSRVVIDIVEQELLISQTKGLTNQEFIIPTKFIQSYTLSQSIWLAKRQLVHLQIRVRRGDSWRDIRNLYLPMQAAMQLKQQLNGLLHD